MNLYSHLWRDRQQLTRDRKMWREYLCWCIGNWMDMHRPIYPLWLRHRLLNLYPLERHGTSWRMFRHWQEIQPDNTTLHLLRPLPWYIGTYALGPFVRPWKAIARWFHRRRGGRSHRCEFTDSSRGALYGGQEGGFMEELFVQFLRNIEADDA